MIQLKQVGECLLGVIFIALVLSIAYIFALTFIDAIRYDKVEAVRRAKWEADCIAMNGQIIYIHNTAPICTKKGSDFLGQYR